MIVNDESTIIKIIVNDEGCLHLRLVLMFDLFLNLVCSFSSFQICRKGFFPYQISIQLLLPLMTFNIASHY